MLNVYVKTFFHFSFGPGPDLWYTHKVMETEHLLDELEQKLAEIEVLKEKHREFFLYWDSLLVPKPYYHPETRIISVANLEKAIEELR